MQPPANIINKLADALGTSVDFLISGDKTEKAKASLKNSELIPEGDSIKLFSHSLLNTKTL